MNDITEMVIRVKTEELITASGEVENCMKRLENAMNEAESIVKRSSGYWKGKGAESHYDTYMRKTETIREAVKRFRNNKNSLLQIAGVYETAIGETNSIAQSLPGDIL